MARNHNAKRQKRKPFWEKKLPKLEMELTLDDLRTMIGFCEMVEGMPMAWKPSEIDMELLRGVWEKLSIAEDEMTKRLEEEDVAS